MSLRDKVAVVTGAGQGLGQAVAQALARAGARVAVVDVNPDSAQRTADAIARAGGVSAAHVTDVSHKLAVQTMLYTVIERWGRLDILVNAAHVAPSSPALRLDEWEWNRVLDVNLKGAFLMAQTAARAMRETGGGMILNMLWPAGKSPHAAVRAAREGLRGLTLALADEWAALGVRVEWLEPSGDATQAAVEALRRCEARGPAPTAG